MVENPPSPPAGNPSGRGCFKWVALLTLSILLVTGAIAWKMVDEVRPALAALGGWFRDLPGKLTSEEIAMSFRESVTRVLSTNGDVLEIATLEKDETVTRYDMRTALWDTVYLGTTTSEIRAPVVYRYHIRLSDDWDVRIDGDRCVVRAPAIRPSLPPAIRTERIEKKSEAGWLRFNAAENLAALEKDLTPTLEKRAGNTHHIDLVREKGRQSVAEFVKRWLLQPQVRDRAGVRSIVVIFPDEAEAGFTAATHPPTLMLERP